jgi:hypothetical protein
MRAEHVHGEFFSASGIGVECPEERKLEPRKVDNRRGAVPVGE